jgi:hypothetical protein
LREQIGEKIERRAGVDFSAPLREPEDEPPQKPSRPSPGKASRSPASSPHRRERWKGKRNAALGKPRRK